MFDFCLGVICQYSMAICLNLLFPPLMVEQICFLPEVSLSPWLPPSSALCPTHMVVSLLQQTVQRAPEPQNLPSL